MASLAEMQLFSAPQHSEVIASTGTREHLPVIPSLSQDEPFSLQSYIKKFEGARELQTHREGVTACHAWSTFVGCFAFIAVTALAQEYLLPGLSETYKVTLVLLTAAWGADAIHVFSCWDFNDAQPKNVIIGNTLGGFIGVLVFKVAKLASLQNFGWLQAAVATSLTVGAQEFLGAVHPAGAALAVIYIGEPEVQHLHWHYVLCPCLVGSLLLVSAAVVLNNLSMGRTYPQAWWPSAAPSQSSGRVASIARAPATTFMVDSPGSWIEVYLQKFQGLDAPGPPANSLSHIRFSVLSSFLSMVMLGLILEVLPLGTKLPPNGFAAAAAVSIFSDWRGPASQPKNCVLGSLLGALAGVATSQAARAVGGHLIWLQTALAVAFAAAAQECISAEFPAGGALAFAFVNTSLQEVGWVPLVVPALVGCLLLMGLGVVFNNLSSERLYPRCWPWQVLYPPPAPWSPIMVPVPEAGKVQGSWRYEAQYGPAKGEGGRPHPNVFFGLLTIIMQITILVFFFYAELDLSGSEETDSSSIYNYYVGVALMMFVGFGYLMTFLKAYGLGAVGFTMVITCLGVQWSMILEGLMATGKLVINFMSLLNGNFAVAAVLISFGGLIGKVSPLQILCATILELICYCANKVYFLQQYHSSSPLIQDCGGTIIIHVFGAYFGLAACQVLGPARMDRLNESDYRSDLFSLIGTVFLWLFWPSFVAGALPSGEQQTKALLNTVIALLGSTASTFAATHLMRGKLRTVPIQNATLAGGVAIGAMANFVGPGPSLAVGLLAGALSTAGFVYSPFFGSVDTCGIHNLHGMPGLLGGIASAFVPLLSENTDVMPLNQVFGLLGTLIFACASGWGCGHILMLMEGPEQEAFADEVYWHCADDIPRSWVKL
eukprot:TRINITY_DN3038_c0_g1_i1.p1 TRINITY_DN3038_c0_g1~~TRINITY_DN3038_c0_g1_i1.p1  ORF type:complete len:885 (+),score=163.58 TRINITY_DN3038_c0_g1_i1:57-2711(+)